MNVIDTSSRHDVDKAIVEFTIKILIDIAFRISVRDSVSRVCYVHDSTNVDAIMAHAHVSDMVELNVTRVDGIHGWVQFTYDDTARDPVMIDYSSQIATILQPAIAYADSFNDPIGY